MAENTQFIPAAQSQSATNPLEGLKRLAVKGAFWTVGGYGTKQILRMANRWLLAKLLLPEMFGLMAIVDVVILGLNLFSDFGISQCIIQNRRGDDPAFLNTAWTVQVIRGLVLATIATLLARPAAAFYGEPILVYLLPVAGLTAIFQGFISTKKFTANRNLQMKELMIIELISYIIGISIMIYGAIQYRSIWALVAGGVITAFIEMVLTHFALKGPRNRFDWDKTAFTELYNFGGWILFSTALTFLAFQSDKLIIGKLTSTTFLGIYTTALVLSRMADDAIKQLGVRVLFPSYSQLQRDNPEHLYKVLRQARFILIILSWSASLIFIFFGQNLIDFMFGDEWAEAGWMLELLALGTLVGVIGLTYDNVLIAKGRTFVVAVLNGLHLLILISGIFIGNYVLGDQGIILGVVCVGWLIYPFKAIWLRKYKLWQPELDLPFIGLAFALVGFIYYVL